MGLFGSVKKATGGLFNGDFAERAAMAQAFMNDDYGGAFQIMGEGRKRQAKQQEAEAEQQALGAVRNGLRQRGYRDSDIDVLMADPRTAAALVQSALETRQFGPGGGSVRNVDPATGQGAYEWAPRVDEDGSFFGPGRGDQAPPVLREGVKTIPIVPGGQVVPVGAISGQEIGAGGPPIPQASRGGRLDSWRPEMFDRPGGPPPLPNFAPPQRGPQPGTIEDGYRFKGGNPADRSAWEKVGGPSPQGSGGFRLPY